MWRRTVDFSWHGVSTPYRRNIEGYRVKSHSTFPGCQSEPNNKLILGRLLNIGAVGSGYIVPVVGLSLRGIDKTRLNLQIEQQVCKDNIIPLSGRATG